MALSVQKFSCQEMGSVCPPLESGGHGTISTIGEAGSDAMWLWELVINSVLFPQVCWHTVSGAPDLDGVTARCGAGANSQSLLRPSSGARCASEEVPRKYILQPRLFEPSQLKSQTSCNREELSPFQIPDPMNP